jgi:hypothetical protein
MYLGACVEREKVEKAYGRPFPMNTVFMAVNYEPYDEQLYGLDMPYDYIHGKKEGDTILLTVNGKQCTIRCKQLKDRCEEKFEAWLEYSMDKFSKRADWYPAEGNDGEEVLISGGVVFKDIYGRLQHGKNKSPYVKDE